MKPNPECEDNNCIKQQQEYKVRYMYINFILFLLHGAVAYGSWIYSYLCNQCLLPLTLWVQIPLRSGVLDIALCDKIRQWLVAGRWFPQPKNWPPWYSWNIVESGIKHHNPNTIILHVQYNLSKQTLHNLKSFIIPNIK